MATRQACGGSEDAVEARVSRSGSQSLGDPVVVGQQVVLVDVEMPADCQVGEVEHVEVDGRTPDAATELERVDAVVDEVAEEFGPCGLLLIGGVPHAGFALPVVPARSSGGVGEGGEGVLR